MKILTLATLFFAAVINSVEAQVPGNGLGVPSSPPPLPAQVKIFTVKRGDHTAKFLCNQGLIQSLSAVHLADEKNVHVVFLDPSDKDIPEDTWSPAHGFRFAVKAQDDDVRVTMICGGQYWPGDYRISSLRKK